MKHSTGASPGIGKTEQEILLQRIGVELSVIAQGADSQLDKILEQLRVLLRQHGKMDANRLRKIAELLFQHLASQPVNRTGDCQLLAESLQDLLQELQVPVANFSDVQGLAVAAGRAKTQDAIVEVLQRAVQLLQSVNQFAGDTTGSPAKAADAAATDKSKGKGWLKRIGVGKDEMTAADIFDSLKPMLDQVLDKLGLLDDISRQVVVIKAQLPSITDPVQMQRVLEQVLQLLGSIASNISSERRDTERFLGQLREKLQGIEQGIVGTVDAELLNRVELLQSNIGEQVTGIQQAIGSENSIDSMRQLVEKRVENIGGTLQSYLDTERERHRDSERQVKDLTRKLREMELEGQQLRAMVHEKQAAATKDPLTGATNRFGYEERVMEELARSRRMGFPLAMVVVDVDKFKDVNDTYGHKAGDLVLQKVVDVMIGKVRKTDCVARYGGDEFVLLLPDTTAEGALVVAEKIRLGVESCGFHSNGQPVNVTICCGITEVKDTDTPESAFERADSGMYQAKNNKRNGCMIV